MSARNMWEDVLGYPSQKVGSNGVQLGPWSRDTLRNLDGLISALAERYHWDTADIIITVSCEYYGPHVEYGVRFE